MLRRVVDFLACWKRRVGWNAISSLLKWCIRREMNTQSFDDRERTSSDLRTCFLKSLFEWIFATVFLYVYSYADFCFLFSRFLFGGCFMCT
jgi:hypothetical protein